MGTVFRVPVVVRIVETPFRAAIVPNWIADARRPVARSSRLWVDSWAVGLAAAVLVSMLVVVDEDPIIVWQPPHVSPIGRRAWSSCGIRGQKGGIWNMEEGVEGANIGEKTEELTWRLSNLFIYSSHKSWSSVMQPFDTVHVRGVVYWSYPLFRSCLTP
jgi:hypothetical protein